LGVVPARSAAPLNLVVGSAQVVLPTIILIQHGADPAIVNATWPTYLFGITYLYYGLGILLDLEPQGLGWFSAFVAAIAAFQAVLAVGPDPVFAVIWLTWAVMWSLFFLLMALGRDELARFTGRFLALLGVPTCTVSALFLLQGSWTYAPAAGWAELAGLLSLSALAWRLTRSSLARSSPPRPVPADPSWAGRELTGIRSGV
ncbi:MAG: AmiS/UreI family transporter, partial [Dermatophilaceae bacterium]